LFFNIQERLSTAEQELTRLRIISIDESKPNALNYKIEQLIEENEKLTDSLREKKIEVQELKLKLLIQQEEREGSLMTKRNDSNPASSPKSSSNSTSSFSLKEKQALEEQIKQLGSIITVLKEEREMLAKKVEELMSKGVLQSIPEETSDDEVNPQLDEKIMALIQENERVLKSLNEKERELGEVQKLLSIRDNESKQKQNLIENLVAENGNLRESFEKKIIEMTSKMDVMNTSIHSYTTAESNDFQKNDDTLDARANKNDEEVQFEIKK
jgi:chromosome segregation ATPase